MVTDEKELEQARAGIAVAYDPSLLKDAGQRLNLLGNQLERALGSRGPVLRWEAPAAEVHRAGVFLDEPDAALDPESLTDHFSGLVEVMLAHGLNLHDPRFMETLRFEGHALLGTGG